MSTQAALPQRLVFDEPQLTKARERLEAAMTRAPGLSGLLVATVDGNMVLSAAQTPFADARMATMSSALLAICETLGRESGQKTCRFVVLENELGRIISLRINSRLTLTGLSSKQSNLGLVLTAGQAAARDLAALLAV